MWEPLQRRSYEAATWLSPLKRLPHKAATHSCYTKLLYKAATHSSHTRLLHIVSKLGFYTEAHALTASNIASAVVTRNSPGASTFSTFTTPSSPYSAKRFA